MTTFTTPRNRFIAVIVFVVLVVGWYGLLRNWSRESVAAIPVEERRAIVERGLATLHETCRPPVRPELEALCRDQAELVSALPECGTDCRSVVARFMHRPTR